VSRFRQDIQGLRAAAVLPVVLFHFGVVSVSGGFAGVDVFFVISGFVICIGLIEKLKIGQFSLRDFYIRRARRILPPLLVTCACTLAAAYMLLLPPDLVDFSKSLFATVLSVSNFYFWKQSGYFAPESQTQPLLHCWSLGVEEQFYLFMPLAMMVAQRFLKGRWLALIVPVWLASFVISIASAFVAPTSGFFLLPSRAWELATGAGLAVLASQSPYAWIKSGHREVAALLGSAMVLASYFLLDESMAFPAWNALLPCGGAALIIWAGSGAAQQPILNRILSWAPFGFIGAISYSLYLVHWPLASFFHYRFMNSPTVLQSIILLSVSLALASAMHFLVEKRVRDRARISTSSLVITGAVIATALFVFIGTVLATSGFPTRFPGYEPSERVVTQWGGPHCFNEDRNRAIDWDPTLCTRVHGISGKMLVWGDSYAADYGAGLVAHANLFKVDILQYTSAGCPPILADHSLSRLACAKSNSRVLGIIKSQKINTVVLAARWSNVPRRSIARLHETVDAIRRLGAKVVVIGQTPEFAAPVRRIDWLSGQSKKKVGYWAPSFNHSINLKLAEEARGATFVDPMKSMCPESICVYRIGMEWLYQDFGHLSDAGSRIAVARYFPRS
jgi:peptidoglycan/LPS O-acetylase OafA/YrhL